MLRNEHMKPTRPTHLSVMHRPIARFIRRLGDRDQPHACQNVAGGKAYVRSRRRLSNSKAERMSCNARSDHLFAQLSVRVDTHSSLRRTRHDWPPFATAPPQVRDARRNRAVQVTLSSEHPPSTPLALLQPRPDHRVAPLFCSAQCKQPQASPSVNARSLGSTVPSSRTRVPQHTLRCTQTPTRRRTEQQHRARRRRFGLPATRPRLALFCPEQPC
ncbi:hypothetical protein C8Q76DRAFT_247771 [Earliella scabrosa]|nr:hypothetical protein C8Q76DRAFT_247771 [Earliella scabrosa]